MTIQVLIWNATRCVITSGVESKAGGYEVSRFVIRPTAEIPLVGLHRVTQRVESDGKVLTLSSESLPLPVSIQVGLGFPRFL